MSPLCKRDRLNARCGAGLAALGLLAASGAGGLAQAETVTGVTQYGYDAAGRQVCATVRMNPAAFGASVAACSLGVAGADGPDRVAYTEYDAANQVTRVTSGYGTSAPYTSRVEKVVTYTANGKQATLADGKGNLTTYEYDGLDRLVKERLPAPATAGTSSTTDYNQYGYDAAGNRTSWRQRDGVTYSFTFDALNRVQNGLRGETYAYDNLNRRISAALGAQTSSVTYDALGRMTGETTNGLAMAYGYDQAGRRTQITWPDAFSVTYGYNPAGDLTGLWGTSGAPLMAWAYDDQGRETASGRTNGVQTNRWYDAAGRLETLFFDPPGTASDQVWLFAHNADSQVKVRASSGNAYEWAGTQSSKTYGVNGLNQLTTAAGTAIAYDARGNLTGDGTHGYAYDAVGNLTGETTAAVGLAYEPTGRLWSVVGGGTTTRFLYSGPDLVAEINPAGQILRRYVPGPGTDEPLIWYEGSGTSDPRWLLQDAQDSVVAVTNAAGAATINTYDEYGVPGASNQGRFQYTGQAWIPELGLYHYKARAYSATLGRFLQTDPTGYDDGLNWYAYVGNDPMNRSDPTGEFAICVTCLADKVVGAFNGVMARGAFVGIRSAQVRQEYKQGVAGLDKGDSAGRTALKADARAKTPAEVRAVVEGMRPGTGPKPGSGGTASRTSGAADALGETLGRGGKALGVLGVGAAVVDIATADDKLRASTANASAFAGGYAGGEIGAGIGAFGGPFAPVTVPAGGLIGAAVGGHYGYKAGEDAYNAATSP